MRGSAGITPDGVEAGCQLEGGQSLEITDSKGNVTLSVCERADGTVDECNWGLPSRTQPASNRLQDRVPVGGVLDNELVEVTLHRAATLVVEPESEPRATEESALGVRG